MAGKGNKGTAQDGLSNPYSWAGKNGPSYTPTESQDYKWTGGAGSERGVQRGKATPGTDLRPETRKRGR